MSVGFINNLRGSRQACHHLLCGGVGQRPSRKQAGFTLIEVLVAMTIIAVGVSALVSSAAASAWRADYLREREFGRWTCWHHCDAIVGFRKRLRYLLVQRSESFQTLYRLKLDCGVGGGCPGQLQ